MTSCKSEVHILVGCLCLLLVGGSSSYDRRLDTITDVEQILDDLNQQRSSKRLWDTNIITPSDEARGNRRLTHELLSDMLQTKLEDDDRFRSPAKRVLSVLTRWPHFGGQWGQALEKETRKMPRAPMAMIQNSVGGGTKDMPLRRVGGPLRWGR